MSYAQNHTNQNYCECEFTVPIKLNIPITIDSPVYVNPVPITKQKLPVFIEPDLVLEPEVRAKTPICYPDYQQQLPYSKPEVLPANN
ncbi:MAG: hypothetical protein KI793_25490 [Rivularia sp. (in: Bacteria)]|nr:hypothetical protein [Rivularia sp. MS3]